MMFSSLARSCLALSACAISLWSADFTFAPASGTTGDWNTAANWSPNGVPNQNNTVDIPASFTATISGTAYAADIEIHGTLELTRDSLNTRDESFITVYSGGVLAVSGSANLLQSTLAVTDIGTPSNSVDPTTIVIQSGGNLSLSSGKTLTLQNGIKVTNAGTITLAEGAAFAYENESLLSEFTSTGTIAWTMGKNASTSIRFPAVVNLSGTLNGTLASGYIPDVDDTCSLLTPLLNHAIADFTFDTTSVPGNFNTSSTSNEIFFTCATSILVDQTVTNTTVPGTLTYGDSLTLTATVAPSHAVTWSSSDTSKVTVSGSTATMVGSGSGVVLTATSAAYGTYRAGHANLSLGTIAPKDVTVTVIGGSRQVGGTNPTPTITTNGLVTGDLASTLGTPVYSGTGTTADTTTVAGTYPLTVSFTSANLNYNITVVDGNLVITTPSSSSTTDAAAGGGGGGGCGVGGGMALLAVGMALARRRR